MAGSSSSSISVRATQPHASTSRAGSQHKLYHRQPSTNGPQEGGSSSCSLSLALWTALRAGTPAGRSSMCCHQSMCAHRQAERLNTAQQSLACQRVATSYYRTFGTWLVQHYLQGSQLGYLWRMEQCCLAAGGCAMPLLAYCSGSCMLWHLVLCFLQYMHQVAALCCAAVEVVVMQARVWCNPAWFH